MRFYAVSICALALTGCTAFPRTPEEAKVDIRAIVDSIECELAAVATSEDPDVRGRDIANWNALTDIDFTLVRSIGVDGNAKVTAPAGLGIVSGTPKLGFSDTDTRGNHIKFANSFKSALAKFGNTCFGPNPSETNMGLAYWFEGSVKAVGKDSLVGISFTKQFEIVASAGTRFGYTLTPVTNTVAADAGGGASLDYTNRFTIALTPPPPKPVPPKPTRVFVVNWPPTPVQPAPPPPAFKFDRKGEPGLMLPESVPPTADNAERKKPPEAAPAPRARRPTPPPPPAPATPRERALEDPELQMMLQRKSPVTLAPQ